MKHFFEIFFKQKGAVNIADIKALSKEEFVEFLKLLNRKYFVGHEG
jgi:hypothetical protein